jgi:hypothetical protein
MVNGAPNFPRGSPQLQDLARSGRCSPRHNDSVSAHFDNALPGPRPERARDRKGHAIANQIGIGAKWLSTGDRFSGGSVPASLDSPAPQPCRRAPR